MHYVVKAPTRADLAGGTLDIWPLYCLVGPSKTVNVALDLYAEVEVTAKGGTPFQLSMSSSTNEKASFKGIPERKELDRLPAGVRFPAWVVTSYLSRLPELPAVTLEMKFRTGAPPRSGLGGSSALCVALLRATARYLNTLVDQGWQLKMLEWARDIEAAFLNVPTGTQDYLAALFGGLKSYQWDIGGLNIGTFSNSVFEALGDRTLVLFSGESHDSGASNWEILKGAIEGRPDILKGFHAIRDIAAQVHEELEAGVNNWGHIGKLLNEEWRVRRELFKVNTPRLDEMITFLNQEGVLAAKVCGAASGGSLLVLVEPGQKTKVAEKCRAQNIQVLNTKPVNQGVFIEDLP